jgi:hypothetical protein
LHFDNRSIEELAALRDQVSALPYDKVALRQRELQDDANRLGGLVTTAIQKRSTGARKGPLQASYQPVSNLGRHGISA